VSKSLKTDRLSKALQDTSEVPDWNALDETILAAARNQAMVNSQRSQVKFEKPVKTLWQRWGLAGGAGSLAVVLATVLLVTADPQSSKPLVVPADSAPAPVSVARSTPASEPSPAPKRLASASAELAPDLARTESQKRSVAAAQAPSNSPMAALSSAPSTSSSDSTAWSSITACEKNLSNFPSDLRATTHAPWLNLARMCKKQFPQHQWPEAAGPLLEVTVQP
jgi:hypothetical protein